MGHNGFLNNVSITLIDKTEGKNHKKKQDYWRRTLKTYLPFRLNVDDQPHVAKNVAYWLPFTVECEFWLGRDSFWTKNLDAILQVC